MVIPRLRARVKVLRHVRLLHEASARDPAEALAELCHLDLLAPTHSRRVRRDNSQHDDLLVEHLVVLQVVEHPQVARGRRCRAKNTALPGTRDGGSCEMLATRTVDSGRCAVKPLGDKVPSLFPCRHHGEHAGADDQREPRPVCDLGEVGTEEGKVDDEKEADKRPQATTPSPAPAGDGEKQHCGDRHRRHRHPVGRSEMARAAKPRTSAIVANMSSQFTCGM